MKTRLLLSLLAASTGAAEDLVPPAVAPVSWVDPADPSAAPFREEGEQWTNRVGHLMVYEVERDIAERGVARAVELVHLKDLTLPDPVPGQPRITALKRISLELRNPDNRPDAADQAALERFKSDLNDGEDMPSVLMQKLDRPGQPTEWRVYRPLVTLPLCLKCHGPLEGIKPEVRAYLARKYPRDKATGYTAYRWRGFLRVSLAAPAEPAAKAK